MRFFVRNCIPNILNVAWAGSLKLDKGLLRAELLTNHRVSERYPLIALLPKGRVGAEIGVFTGLFSTALLALTQPKKMYFVDPWWKEFGPLYPDWGIYTDHGKLPTAAAHQVATERIAKHARGVETDVAIEHSMTFLSRMPDHHFDWVYLDSTHSYEGTREELELLRRKIKPGGILAGDDWHESPDHPHYGVAQAIKEAMARGEFEMIRLFPALQWAIRVNSPAARDRQLA
jgi:hypothetical protein